MSSPKYYTHIDGLRAIAVLSVFLFHLKARYLPGGFVGVDIFFVISGFVVSASVTTFRGSFREFLSFFYSRRFARILPALLVCLGLTALMTLLFVPQAWLSSGIDRVLRASLIGFANISLIRSRNDYFNPKAESNPFTHTWSLGVEEQFYALFPLLFFLWLTPGVRKSWAMALMGLVTIGSLIWAHSISEIAVAFYGTQARLWQIGLGVLTYQISQSLWATKISLRLSRPLLLNFVGGLCLLALFTSLFITSSNEFPSLGTYLAVISTAILLFILESARDNPCQRLLSLPLLRKIGWISYSLYLYHWPVIVLMRWTLGVESAVSQLAVILISFGLSIASYRWIENPARTAKRRFGLQNWQIITAGLVLILVSSTVARLAFKNQNLFSLSVTARDSLDWYPEGKTFSFEGCQVVEEADPLEPQFRVIHRQGDCETKHDLPKIFVIGDSHAATYLGLLKKISLERGYEIHMKMTTACPLVSLIGPASAQTVDCQKFLAFNTEKVAQMAAPDDILFLPGLRLHRLTNQARGAELTEDFAFAQMTTAHAQEERRAAMISAESELRPFLDKKMKILFEAPKPIFRTPAYRCADWFNKNNPVCADGLMVSRSKVLHYRQPVYDSLLELAQAHPQITVWDPFSGLCPKNESDTCPLFRDGKPLFFDQDHVSTYGSLLLYTDFARALEALN